MRILVIDDDPILNSMLVQMLTGVGYDVHFALDGKKGLAMYLAQAFDLIITDIVMPEKEGLEVISAIRKRNRTIPIIAISGGGRIEPDLYMVMAKQFGADYAFQKPFEKESFLAAVRECLEGIP